MKSFGTWYMDPPFIFNVKTQTDIHVSFIYPLICILEKMSPRLTFNAFAGLLQFRDKPKQQLTNVCARCYKPHDVMDDFFVHGTSLVGNIKEIRDPQVNKRAVITLL